MRQLSTHLFAASRDTFAWLQEKFPEYEKMLQTVNLPPAENYKRFLFKVLEQ
jgi:hypothetical protein